MKIDVIKRKLLCLIERIKLSEDDYRMIKVKAEMYDDMMSTIEYDVNTEYVEAKDNQGCTIVKIPKSTTMVCNVDIEQMLANGGVTFDKNRVKINIIGR